MNDLIPPLSSQGQILAHVNGCLGVITLNRPEALNALSLAMVRDMTVLLRHWASDPRVQAVVMLGAPRPGKGPVFCAGGDIRFMHGAVLRGDPDLDAFFTEEYRLDHLIHSYAKPTLALMEGFVMGGGMGISQGAKLRVLTEHSRLAMPETRIGLFPDVGAGWFLGQCPGHIGEWLALTGTAIACDDAIEWGLGDVYVQSQNMPGLIEALCHGAQPSAEHVVATVMERADLAPPSNPDTALERIDRHFGQPSVAAIMGSLQSDPNDWAQATLRQLQTLCPTLLAVSLARLRRARGLTLAQQLRAERDTMHHCFHARPPERCDAVEGIRALAIDKDHQPRWQPARIADVDAAEVEAFLASPWAPGDHPLADLA